jgi:hypothetical protein
MRKLIGLIIVTAFLLLAGCPASPVIEKPQPSPELYDEVWTSPGKVMVSNLYPGAKNVEYPLTIHNGYDQPTEFSVTFLAAGDVDKDTGYIYVAAPEEAQDWVIIADPTPVLDAKETREVLIAVEMPEDATAPAKRWEFRVVVGWEGPGMLQRAYTCRWLVTMK